MITREIAKLAAARVRVQRLERGIQKEIHRELAALPSRYGFPDVGAFIKAVKGAHRDSRLQPAEKRTRKKITERIRGRIKAMAEGKIPGSSIAKKLGISVASVHNVKKSLGLVKARS